MLLRRQIFFLRVLCNPQTGEYRINRAPPPWRFTGHSFSRCPEAFNMINGSFSGHVL
jgi:hypothetical protein